MKIRPAAISWVLVFIVAWALWVWLMLGATAQGQTVPSPIVQAGKSMGVASIRTGRSHPVLCGLAEFNAKAMAARGYQGNHPGWDARCEYARQHAGSYEYSEITAESWPGQNETQSATEILNSWRQSPGHWSVANGRCKIYGFGMARGRNGIYFGVGIIGK